MALEHLVAVSAGAVELAEVVDGEVGDGEGAAAVVLEDLVFGALGSAADDGGDAGFLVDGQGVLLGYC